MHIIMLFAKYVRFKFTIAPPSSNIGDIVASGAGIVNLRAARARYGSCKIFPSVSNFIHCGQLTGISPSIC